MLSEADAHAICYAQINKPDPYWPDKSEILIVKTEETQHSWVFFYQSKLYVEHGDFSQQLVGNGPCVVLKSDGRLAFTATFPPIDERIVEAEAWLISGGTSSGRSVVAG